MGKQEVTFPSGTSETITYPMLQQYAADFPWLSGFQDLAEGKSVKTWICFLTISPVLSLGRVDKQTTQSQLSAMCDHLDFYQPNKPNIQDHPPSLASKRRVEMNPSGCPQLLSAMPMVCASIFVP